MTVRTRQELLSYLTDTFIPTDKTPAALSNTKINAAQHKTFLNDLLDSINIGAAVDNISLSNNSLNISKTDGTTDSISLPEGVSAVSQNSVTGQATFTFSGNSQPVTIQTITNDEETILTSISGLLMVANDGKVLSIDSNGNLALRTVLDSISLSGNVLTINNSEGTSQTINLPTSVSSVSQDTSNGTTTFSFNGTASDVTIQSITDSEQALLTTLLGFQDSSNSGMVLSINSSGNLALISQSTPSGEVQGVREISLANNTLTVLKTDNTSETIALPSSVSTVSQDTSAGTVTFSFNGSASDIIVQTISDNEEAILTTIAGFEDAANSGRILSINSSGNLVLIDAPSGTSSGVTSVSQDTSAGTLTFTLSDNTTVTTQSISDNEEALLTTLLGFEDSANDGKIVSIDSNGNFVLIDAPSGGGGTPPADSSHTAYMFFQTNDSTPSTIPSTNSNGPANNSQTFTVPSATNDSYLIIAQPSVANEIVSIVLDGLDQFDAFSKSSQTFTYNSIDYEYWISNNILIPSEIEGETITVRRA